MPQAYEPVEPGPMTDDEKAAAEALAPPAVRA
jgi:hypothetical protein